MPLGCRFFFSRGDVCVWGQVCLLYLVESSGMWDLSAFLASFFCCCGVFFIALHRKPCGLHLCCLGRKKNADHFLLPVVAHEEACIFHSRTRTRARTHTLLCGWCGLCLQFISPITIKTGDKMDIACEVQSFPCRPEHHFQPFFSRVSILTRTVCLNGI